ncbi:MAG: class I SAM-dependent methyltransferase [Dehalococcoidia bacterium]|nr:MAG: class I SAM-dependent methyltransferase [Dehalococcoidia bacterium]
MATIKEVFDQIAPSWYNFRHHSIFRRELEALAARWGEGRLLNLGCAHGPDFLPFKPVFELHGADLSTEMLRFARKYSSKYDFRVHLTAADVRSLPYCDNTFDFAVSVATYHHVKGKADKLAALRELKRVLKSGGEAFITVWNRWQPRFWFKGREVAVPWRTREKTFYRYYYLFTYFELESLVNEAGLEMIKSFPEHDYRFPIKYFSRNICLLLRKA